MLGAHENPIRSERVRHHYSYSTDPEKVPRGIELMQLNEQSTDNIKRIVTHI